MYLSFILSSETHFMLKHRGDLHSAHFEMKPILDDLLAEGVISSKDYSMINERSWGKMSMLLSCLDYKHNEILYDILEKHEPDFIKYIKTPKHTNVHFNTNYLSVHIFCD